MLNRTKLAAALLCGAGIALSATTAASVMPANLALKNAAEVVVLLHHLVAVPFGHHALQRRRPVPLALGVEKTGPLPAGLPGQQLCRRVAALRGSRDHGSPRWYSYGRNCNARSAS